MMLNKNYDVKRNKGNIYMYILNIFLKMLMLNKVFTFYYQLFKTPTVTWNLVFIWIGSRRD